MKIEKYFESMKTTKIKSVRSLGIHDTYNLEMQAPHHNYILDSGLIHKNSHAVSYVLQSFRCLYLKGHFPAEWWASVLSSCVREKMIRYMNIARAEGVTFDTLNANNLTMTFTATGDVVNPGMITVKKLGKKAAKKIQDTPGPFRDFDDFVQKQSPNGLNKTAYERLIKLGSFNKMCDNAMALWAYYQCRYLKGTETNKFRKRVYAEALVEAGWSEEKIINERKRQLSEYFALYPKRKKPPTSIAKWMPSCSCDPNDNPLVLVDLEYFKRTCRNFTLNEILSFENEYLGYYIHSPLSVFKSSGGLDIAGAIDRAGKNPGLVAIEVVINNIEICKSKNDNYYARVTVSDGIQEAIMFIWTKELALQDADVLKVGVGVKAYVDYDVERKNFTMGRGKALVKLIRK